MNLVEEGMMEIAIKAAQYGVRMKEIVLPTGQYLAFAHACKVHEPDAKPRAYADEQKHSLVQVHDSFRFASPSGYVTIRCASDAPDPKMVTVAAEIVEERQRQVKKFGEQHHPDGRLSTEVDRALCVAARDACDRAAANGTLSWRHILEEELFEALAETDPVKLRAELIQVAAVCAAWVEDIDSRK